MLERKLLVVTGKGGVGKTTIAAALGLLAAERGLRTIVVELGEQRRLPTLFGARRRAASGRRDEAARSACGASRSTPTGRCSSGCRRSADACRVACSPRSGTFQYFAAAAPGAKELVSMVKIWELTRAASAGAGEPRGYDLVVLDAPGDRPCARIAALAADVRRDRAGGTDIRSGRAGAGAARGPDAHRLSGGDTGRPRWRSARRSTCGRDCAHSSGVELDAMIVNGVLPQRFDGRRASPIARLAAEQAARADAGDGTARRCSPPARCTSARASSTIRSRACAVAAVRGAHGAVRVHTRARPRRAANRRSAWRRI